MKDNVDWKWQQCQSTKDIRIIDSEKTMHGIINYTFKFYSLNIMYGVLKTSSQFSL